MALQGIWSGTISFSLVAIPVRLVRAATSGRVALRTLHRSDYSPLARRMFCPQHQALVPPDQIVRGFELAPDHDLPLSAAELESLAPERSRTIEIVEFVPLAELDPLYFERPYYLVPLKGGEKAYQLLAAVLQQTGQAGLAKLVLAEREHLVAVKSTEGALTLLTLHEHADLLAPEADVPRAGDPELKVRIETEIRQRLADFAPAHYADARREQLLTLLRHKAQVQAPVTVPVAAEDDEGGPPDLMATLEAAMREVRQQP